MIDIKDVSLFDIMPDNLLEDEQVAHAAKAIDAELQKTSGLLDRCLILSRIDELDEDVIDELAWQFHVDVYNYSFPLQVKRELVKQSIAWHKIKGTPYAVEFSVTQVAGNCNVSEWPAYGGKPYYFQVNINIDDATDVHTLTDSALDAIDKSKNKRSWLDCLNLIYPAINLPSERPKLTVLSLPTINLQHIPWNVGSTAIVRLNAKYEMDGTTRLDALDPKEGYHEEQHHILSLSQVVGIDIINTRINILNGESAMDGSKLLDGEHITHYTVTNDITMDVVPLECRPHTYGSYHNYDGSATYSWPFQCDGSYKYDGSVLAGFSSGSRADQPCNTGPNYYDGTATCNGSKRFGWTDSAGKGGTKNL